MMKPFSSLLIVLLSLSVLTVTAFASDVPTLDDTTVKDEATTQVAPPEPLEEETPAMMPAEPEAAPGEVAPILASVSEIVIAKAVVDREPVEPGTLFAADTERLYCHSRIASLTPATITHVWYRNGERVAEIPLQIGAASSWRTWSSKAIFPPTPASWRVEIVAEDGTLLAETDFSVE